MGEAATRPLPGAEAAPPARPASSASGGGWVISASGGVEMLPWNIADKTEVVESVAVTRTKFAAASDTLWQE